MIKRENNILELLNKKQSIFVFGPRGVGKTHLIEGVFKQEKEKNIFISLLQSQNYRKYLTNPELLRQEIERQIVKTKHHFKIAIDEIQKVPQLLDEVHYLIEKYKSRLTFCLSGSSARKLKRSGANLLAGRAITTKLHPLNSREINIDLFRALKFGTLPDTYLSEELEIEKLDSYITTYLREEIQEEALVRQTDKFARFLELAGQLQGEPINFTKLGKSFNVTTKTCQDYFEILVDTLIAIRIDGWSHSVKKQLLQAPKFYFFDCGVLNAINGDLRSELRGTSYRFGKLFEQWIINEIVRMNDIHRMGLRFNYWRSESSGKEVDLIISRSTAKPILAIEIKSFEVPNFEEFKGLELIKEDYPKLRRMCFSRVERPIEHEGIEIIPWLLGLEELMRL